MMKEHEEHLKNLQALKLLEQQEKHYQKTSTSSTTCAKPSFVAIAINKYKLKTEAMKLYILYQTDLWKNKTSCIFFSIFDCRRKALDSAKYNGLYAQNAKVIVEEVTIN